jgi:predicted MFS family arabinose efflux permease
LRKKRLQAMLKSWLPAIGGMVCLGFGPGLIGVYGFFVGPMSEEFDVGVATLNIAPVLLLLVPGFISPAVGRLVDRLPIRNLVLVGVTIAMLSLLGASQSPSLWLAALAFLGFSLGITFYGPVVVNGLMVKLYVGREARALAIAAIGISFATAIVPPTVGLLLSFLDWRATLATLAVAVWLLVCTSTLLSFPVGVVGVPAEHESRLGRQVYRHPAFWLVGFSVALGMNVAVVLAVCYPPLFAGMGFSVAQAGWFLSTAGLAGLVGKTVIAWLGDAGRAYAKWLAAGILVLQASALLLLWRADSTGGVLLAVMLAGFAGGAFLPIQPYLNSRYFDPAVIGRVNGSQMPLFLPFGIIGAPLAGYAFDVTGSYDIVLIVLAAVLGFAALLALRLPRAAM